ncbi:MAG: N-6 DNA methylase, partial [Sulfolobales archaeon]
MSGFLKIFKSHEPKEFGYIRDYVTGSLVKATKEERRRQFIERMLVDDFGYPRDLIGVDVDVVVDGKQLGKVDISIFKDTSVKDPVKNAFAFIMVRSVDLNYLKELLSATNAEYGLIYDYDSYVVLRKSFEKIEEVCRFPMYGEGFENFDKVMDKSILRPAAELGTLIDDIYRYISEVEGLRGSKLLDEFIKLLLLKLGDEVLEDYKSFAWVSNKEFIELNSGSISESFTSRLNTLVDKVRNIFIGVDVKPNVKDRTIIEFFRRLHGVSILRCNDVPKYESLHFIARKHMNVEKGEVLTPYPITDLMVRLINPSKDDLVLDPACGSGRLIAWAIRHVHRKYGFEIKELAKFVKNNVLCIDVDPGAIKLARIYIALYSGVLGNTLVADSLLPFDSLLDISRKASIPEHLLPSSGNFDVILTHPPFNVKDRV